VIVANQESTLTPLKSKVALITGATGGFGSVLANRFVIAGASLILLSRNKGALENLVQQLPLGSSKNQWGHFAEADLKALGDLPELCVSLINRFGVPDILINNAGIQGAIGPLWKNNWQEWEETIKVNFLAPVVLIRAFIPEMIKRGSGKIINISGGGATAPRPNFTAYSCSKVAIVRFSETLAEELRGTGVTVNCIAPGALNTRMTQRVINAGREAGEKEYSRAVRLTQENDIKTRRRAADLAVFLASSASDGVTGKLISAVWDPWERLCEHISELESTDIYTLRRIVPKDRGMDWG
jgi:NAD(P)-dependent dehydrogenase (short-subunit alcohol dehydrogenase family)